MKCNLKNKTPNNANTPRDTSHLTHNFQNVTEKLPTTQLASRGRERLWIRCLNLSSLTRFLPTFLSVVHTTQHAESALKLTFLPNAPDWGGSVGLPPTSAACSRRGRARDVRAQPSTVSLVASNRLRTTWWSNIGQEFRKTTHSNAVAWLAP